MDVENKLDEDYLFYLGFTNSFLRRLSDPVDVEKCYVRVIGEKTCFGRD